MFKTFFEKNRIIYNLQKAYKESTSEDIEEISKIFFNSYGINYKETKILPLNLKNLICELQQQKYIKYSIRGISFAFYPNKKLSNNTNINYNSQRHIIELTDLGKNYFKHLRKKVLKWIIKIFITICILIAGIISFLSDTSSFIINLKSLL